MVLNNNSDKTNAKNKAKNVVSNIKTRRIKRDISLYSTLGTSELASKSTKSINIFGI
jgi:hypothetical protein